MLSIDLAQCTCDTHTSSLSLTLDTATIEVDGNIVLLQSVSNQQRLLNLVPGNGQITINHRALDVYFPLNILQYEVKQPLLVTNTLENYDVTINLVGGGIKGQAEAARMGIARALCQIDAEHRSILKKNGFLTRDSREVERKKPGQPGARRKFQFSKR